MKKKLQVGRKSQKLNIKPIHEVARSVGIKKKYLENYGGNIAKISLEILKSIRKKNTGKYILVTSITPSPIGEGKTVTSIGLAMAFKKLNKKSILCMAQPSLSSIFNSKKVATGGGHARIVPTENINLHFTGDIHAVMAAHNLCAAYLENSIYNGNPLDINPENIAWRRVSGINDRSLRNINTGLGGKADGISRKTGFDYVGSSELIGILTLSSGLSDMRLRIGKIVVGFTTKGKPITCEDIKAAGAMAALLKDAIKPNLVQTSDNTPCLVHSGASEITSLGLSSVIADKIALGFSEYAIAETEHGCDLSVEKFIDIKCRTSGIKPDAVVLVCSVRTLKMHSGDIEINNDKVPREALRENVSAVERGLPNLEHQIEIIKTFGIPVVVCINRFEEDTDKEIHAIERRVEGYGAHSVCVSRAWSSGNQGSLELAKKVMEACKVKSSHIFLYTPDMSVKEKIKRIAKTIYSAKDVTFSDEAERTIQFLRKQKIDTLPVFIVKTGLSISHNPKRKGRPHGFNFPIEEIELMQGAGYITATSANVDSMPSMPAIPFGTNIDIAEEGRIVGIG